MRDFSDVPTKEFVFGTLFVIANKLDTLLERELKEFDITSKQWFLSVIVSSVFDEAPTMKQAASQMGCSHQNVKQVALKLKDKGLLKMEKDQKDQRITRMSLTEKSYNVWQGISPKGDMFMSQIFEGISKEDMERMRTSFFKIMGNLERLDNK